MKRRDRDRIESCRRRLENLRWTLTREYWKEREASRDQDRQSPEDLVDLAVRSYTRDFLLSLGEMERKQLIRIEDALARLEEGKYGICSLCGTEIPEPRLQAVPWAGLCVRCQGLEEEGTVPAVTFSKFRAA